MYNPRVSGPKIVNSRRATVPGILKGNVKSAKNDEILKNMKINF
jgi:hypothetical protein